MNDNGYDGPGYKLGERYESGFDYIARTEGNRPVQQKYVDDPGYKGSENYYNEINQSAKSSSSIISPEDYYDGPGYKSGEGYESGFDYIARTEGNRPAQVVYPEVPRYESGFDAAARENANRSTPIWGSKIDGINVTDLIATGRISPATMKEEDYNIVYTEIMYGYTNNKNILADEIDLIMSKKDIVRDMLMNQYNLAVKELDREKNGYEDQYMIDRKYQFLSTICILKEKGFDLESLRFPNGANDIDFVQLVVMFQEKCRKSAPVKSMIQSPLWFSDNIPKDFNPERAKSVMTVTTDLIKEEYAKNPDRFLAEWEISRKESRVPENQNMPFDAYMIQKYNINVKRLNDVLNEFLEARVEQMTEDEKERKEILMAILQPNEKSNVSNISNGGKVM